MNIWLVVSTVLLFLVGEVSLVYGIFKNTSLSIFGGIIMGYFLLMSLTYKQIPTAMDVYQGKTDIEKVYKDGRVVDSVVVYKNVVYCR